MKLFAIAVLGLAGAVLAGAQGHGFGGPGGPGGPAGHHEFGAAFAGPTGGVVTGAPYSAVQVRTFTQTLAGGNQIQRQEQTKVWRDSQGRVRSESTFGADVNGNGGHTRVTIFDPVAGNMIMLDAQQQTAMVRPFKAHAMPEGAATMRGHVRPGETSEDLGPSVVNGRQATSTRTTHTIPAGSIGNQQAIVSTRTVWMSPDLKVPLQIVTDDPRWGTSTVTLQNIVQSEPDVALFQVPAGFAVRNEPAGHEMHGRGPGPGLR